MDRLYPIHPAEIEPWAKRHGTTRDEARKRFAQYAILEAVAAAPGLAGGLAFKGGNALRFVYGNRRSTLDLDFTADATLPDDPDVIRRRLDIGLRAITSRLLIKARAQRVARKPPGPEKTRPTYEVTVAHAMPGDRFYKNFDLDPKPVPAVVLLEITLNDLICDAVPYRLAPDGRELLVCTLEDVIAEKLRALLQQQIRNRSRPQDVHDVARIVQRRIALDLAKVSAFLVRKAEIREIHPRKSLFNETVKSLALMGYETLSQGDSSECLSFDEAWSCVLDLVRKLEIPA